MDLHDHLKDSFELDFDGVQLCTEIENIKTIVA